MNLLEIDDIKFVHLKNINMKSRWNLYSTKSHDILWLWRGWNFRLWIIRRNYLKSNKDANQNWNGFGYWMTSDCYSLVIANNLFRHELSRLETWYSPKGVYYEHFVLIQKRYQSSLSCLKLRALPRVNINSDFFIHGYHEIEATFSK